MLRECLCDYPSSVVRVYDVSVNIIDGLSFIMQLELIRFITSVKPLLAAARVSERITEVIKGLMLVPEPTKVLDNLLCCL